MANKHPLARVLVVLSWWVKDMSASPKVVAKIKELIVVIKREIAKG